MYTQNTRQTLKVFRCSKLDSEKRKSAKKFYEQFKVAVCVAAIWGNCPDGKCLGRFFLGGNCPGGNHPGGNCPHGDNVRGELSGENELSGGNLPVT